MRKILIAGTIGAALIAASTAASAGERTLTGAAIGAGLAPSLPARLVRSPAAPSALGSADLASRAATSIAGTTIAAIVIVVGANMAG